MDNICRNRNIRYGPNVDESHRIGHQVPLKVRLESLLQSLPGNSERLPRIRELVLLLRSDASRSSRGHSSRNVPRAVDSLTAWESVCDFVGVGNKSKLDKFTREHYRDAFKVDTRRHIIPEQVAQKQAYIRGRRANLLSHYDQPAPDIVPEIIAGYDRRILELEWRRPGSKLGQEFLTEDEYQKALGKFARDAYGIEPACGGRDIGTRQKELEHQIRKVSGLKWQYQKDYPDTHFPHPAIRPGALICALQQKVQAFRTKLVTLRDQDEADSCSETFEPAEDQVELTSSPTASVFMPERMREMRETETQILPCPTRRSRESSIPRFGSQRRRESLRDSIQRHVASLRESIDGNSDSCNIL